MKYRPIEQKDLELYIDDIISCYKDNPMIFDLQCPYSMSTYQGAETFLGSFVDSKDSIVLGIFDEREEYLYGIVIFDNIRMTQTSTAEVHIATSKAIWGKIVLDMYKEILEYSLFSSLYCMIPQNCVLAIGMAKRMGFKKTGYIPKALPYKNKKGEVHLYDIQIFSMEKIDNGSLQKKENN